MDQIKNPFSPGAGSPPPELVGRDDILKKARILLGRVQQRRSEKSFFMVGLRGVGKTVLLNEIEHITGGAGYHTITLEAHEDKSLAALLMPHLRRLLFELDRMADFSEKVRRGLGVLKSFISNPERGTADSGDLEVDLSNLFIAVAEAAQDRKTAIALLIDEIQYLSEKELSALIMAMHKMQQLQHGVLAQRIFKMAAAKAIRRFYGVDRKTLGWDSRLQQTGKQSPVGFCGGAQQQNPGNSAESVWTAGRKLFAVKNLNLYAGGALN